jgi:hypothetical protein
MSWVYSNECEMQKSGPASAGLENQVWWDGLQAMLRCAPRLVSLRTDWKQGPPK